MTKDQYFKVTDFFSYHFVTGILALSQTTYFKLFRIENEFADNDFKFDENGREPSERVENTAGKGEIARHQQLLLFPQCL